MSDTPAIGDQIPPWTLESVDPERMKTMAALLDDSNPIHFDLHTLEKLGMGSRQVNQGPNNIGYVENMLEAWAGAGSIRRLRVRFQSNVLAGDRVVGSGTVTAITPAADASGHLVEAEVALMTGESDIALSGTATVFWKG